ncbi:MAG: hypothetical protein LC733_07410, partial [Actinobacteria bacterium]|nr:hypothetical protein [Actinomycetota bacterium]
PAPAADSWERAYHRQRHAEKLVILGVWPFPGSLPGLGTDEDARTSFGVDRFTCPHKTAAAFGPATFCPMGDGDDAEGPSVDGCSSGIVVSDNRAPGQKHRPFRSLPTARARNPDEDFTSRQAFR